MKKLKFLITVMFSLIIALSSITICHAEEVDKYTKLMLRMETDKFKDDIGRTVFQFGEIKTDKDIKKNGDASYSFNGINDYLSIRDYIDIALGKEDFTIDFFMHPKAFNGKMGVFGKTFKKDEYSCYLDNDKLKFVATTNGDVWDISLESDSLSLNNWYHVAIVRSNSMFILYINGKMVSTAKNSNEIKSSSVDLVIGKSENYNFFNGNIDDFRFSKGIARWTTDFTPPTDDIKTENLTLDKNSLNLLPGKTEKLTATVTPDNIKDKKIIWSTSDKSIAAVDENGNVRALKEGNAVITATVEGTDLKAECKVTVTKKDVPVEPSQGDAVLTITMTNGNIKSYNVTMEKVNDFIKWYEGRANGSNGYPFYKFDKTDGQDFKSKTEYIIFDKISSFEVDER